ncbi:MAG: TauD/TfdA family dioxygenase [Pseudomonadota bacterium]
MNLTINHLPSQIDLRKHLSNDNKILYYRFSDEEKLHLVKSMQIFKENPYVDFKKILRKCKTIDISSNFLKILREASTKPFIFIENLPIDSVLPNTPNSDFDPVEKTYISEYILLLLSFYLESAPYINVGEKNDSVIHNVIPIIGKEHEESGAGSLATFDWHTENIHEKSPTDYFTLLALRGDKNAFTSILAIKDIVKSLPDSLIQKLLTTKFLMKTGQSYTTESSITRTILERDEKGEFSIFYNSNSSRCIALDEEGSQVYQQLKEKINALRIFSIDLRPGDALIINNHKALHKRDGFKISTPENERRWLQRIYLRKEAK